MKKGVTRAYWLVLCLIMFAISHLAFWIFTERWMIPFVALITGLAYGGTHTTPATRSRALPSLCAVRRVVPCVPCVPCVSCRACRLFCGGAHFDQPLLWLHALWQEQLLRCSRARHRLLRLQCVPVSAAHTPHNTRAPHAPHRTHARNFES